MLPQDKLHAVGEIAQRLSNEGFTTEQALSRVRNLAKHDLIWPKIVAGTGVTAPRLYSNGQVAIAAVLSELMHMGIADVSFLREVFISLNTGISDLPPGATANWTHDMWLEHIKALPKQGPMEQAVWFYLANQKMRDHSTWDCQIHVFADTESKWKRVVLAYVIDSSNERIELPGPETGLIPRSAIVIALDPLFARIFRDLKAAN